MIWPSWKRCIIYVTLDTHTDGAVPPVATGGSVADYLVVQAIIFGERLYELYISVPTEQLGGDRRVAKEKWRSVWDRFDSEAAGKYVTVKVVVLETDGTGLVDKGKVQQFRRLSHRTKTHEHLASVCNVSVSQLQLWLAEMETTPGCDAHTSQGCSVSVQPALMFRETEVKNILMMTVCVRAWTSDRYWACAALNRDQKERRRLTPQQLPEKTCLNLF